LVSFYFPAFLPHLGFANTAEKVLQPGDCGSWVIDSASGEVFGHIVASGNFGEAYVLALKLTVENMENSLGVDEVRIPTQGDLELWCLEQNVGRELIAPLPDSLPSSPRPRRAKPTDSGYNSMWPSLAGSPSKRMRPTKEELSHKRALDLFLEGDEEEWEDKKGKKDTKEGRSKRKRSVKRPEAV
jgi:hypothetical protein